MRAVVIFMCFMFSMNFSYANQTNDHESIDAVINAFKLSIQEKNKARFLALFVDVERPMIAVVDEVGYQKRKELVAQYNKEENGNLIATRTFTVTPLKAIDRKIKRSETSRQEILNIKTRTDGNIANVYFDYVFYVDGKKNNWGKESWQLVNTAAGWKISSVIFSIESKPIKDN